VYLFDCWVIKYSFVHSMYVQDMTSEINQGINSQVGLAISCPGRDSSLKVR